MKIFIESLGCPKNLTDAEVMCGSLEQAGHTIVFNEEEANAALLNTCAFLKSARAEATYELRRLLKLKKEGKLKKVVMAGCLVQKNGKKLKQAYPDLDALIDIYSLECAPKAFKSKKFYCSEALALGTADNKTKHTLCAHKSKTRLTLPHSAYLKIADGCNNRCAYCLIPYLRGEFRSKPEDEILEEATDLAKSGAKEISLIAQDTTLYGKDLYGEYRLAKLLKKLVKIKSVKWWRIMYAYPERITEELVEVMKTYPSICHYLDMPLQHISDSILKSMNRLSTENTIKQKIKLLRKAMPDFAIRTNFIVGFPNETQKDFKKLLSFVRNGKLDNVGVFEFSPEAGTAAAVMKNQISAEIKRERASILIDEQSRFLRLINKKIIGKEIEVLLDTPSTGRTYADAPDIDGTVLLTKPMPKMVGKFIKAKITKAEGYQKIAQPL